MNKKFLSGMLAVFYIQTGAFVNFENALNYKNELKKTGYNIVIHGEDKFNKVLIGPFETKEETFKSLRALLESKTINDYFIVKKEEASIPPKIPESPKEKTPHPLALPNKRLSLKSAPSAQKIRETIVETAMKFLNTPYVYGGETNKGFDCSGYTRAVYSLSGISIPRTSALQYKRGKKVKTPQKGDLVFFGNVLRVNHVGIYMGNNKFIHSPSTGKTITIVSLDNSYFKKRFKGFASYLD